MDDAQLAQDMALLDCELIEVVHRHFELRLRHDRASVAALDALYVSALRPLAEAEFQSASMLTAAFLGETVRALAGGHWHLDDRLGPCVVEVPGTPGFLRVLSRAEKRIRQPGPTVLTDFLERACPLRS